MNYDTLLTIAASEDVRALANALALHLGEKSEDAQTFGEPGWQDADGALYAVSSTAVPSSRFVRLGDPRGENLTAPDHAPESDLVSVAEAISVLDVWQGEADRPMPSPGRICAYVTDRDAKALDLLALMGLTRVPTPDEAI